MGSEAVGNNVFARGMCQESAEEFSGDLLIFSYPWSEVVRE